MKTVLVTGCSTGFGVEIARHFLERGWKVVATMRKPREDVLPRSEHLRVLPLDITDPASIRAAVEAAGPIDALVNNAGVGGGAPIEFTSAQTARELFETNVLGTLAVTQAVLPQFRERKSGVVVNISSSTTLREMPIVGVYRASKAAMNALSESLALEVAPLGIRVHVVLPGRSPATSFGDNAQARMQGLDQQAYTPVVQQMMALITDTKSPVTYPKDVAEAVWRVVTDPSAPARLPAGADSEAWFAESGSR